MNPYREGIEELRKLITESGWTKALFGNIKIETLPDHEVVVYHRRVAKFNGTMNRTLRVSTTIPRKKGESLLVKMFRKSLTA